MKVSVKKTLSNVWAALQVQLIFLWPVLKTKAMNYLKQEFVKIALKKILGTALKSGGFKVWLVTFLAKYCFDELLEPAFDLVAHEGEEHADVLKGKFINDKLDEAVKEGDNETYNKYADATFT